MAVNTHLASLMNMAKAAATGLVQNITGTKKKEDLDESRNTALPKGTEEPHLEDTLLRDQVVLTSTETRDQHAREQTVEQRAPWTQAPETRPGGLKGLLKAILSPSQETHAPQPQFGEAVESPTPHLPASGPSPQQMLTAWLQLEPTTIAGLEKFLEVEFAHYPDNYQLFMNKQMMQMIKQAKRLIEEEKLMATLGVTETDTPEAAERAMMGAALLGFVYYQVSRKRRLQRKPGAMTRKEKEEISSIGSKKGGYKNLQQAQNFLKQAEKELQEAMAQGLDDQVVRPLLERVLDVCSEIAQMQYEKVKVTAS